MAIGKTFLGVNPLDVILNKIKKKPEPTPQPAPSSSVPVIPQSEKTPNPVVDNQPQIIRDQSTGRISGVTINGKTYFVGEKDVSAILKAQAPQPTPSGAVEASKVQEQNRLQDVTQGIGQLTPEEQIQLQQKAKEQVQPSAGGQLPGNINLGQAATAGLADTTVGLAGGAVAGAIAGAPFAGVGAIPGAVAGGIVGGIGTFIKGAYSNIKDQQAGLVKAKVENVDKITSNLNLIISAVNNGADPVEAKGVYNQAVARAYQNYAELKLQTQGTAAAFDDGTPQLEKFEIFFDPNGGTLSILNSKMAQAIVNPVAGKVDAQTLDTYANSQN